MTPSSREVRDRRRVGQARRRCRAAPRGIPGCSLREALHVQLVDDRVGERPWRAGGRRPSRIAGATTTERGTDGAESAPSGRSGRRPCHRGPRCPAHRARRSRGRTGRAAAWPGCSARRRPGPTGRARGSRSAVPARRRRRALPDVALVAARSATRSSAPSSSNRQSSTAVGHAAEDGEGRAVARRRGRRAGERAVSAARAPDARARTRPDDSDRPPARSSRSGARRRGPAPLSPWKYSWNSSASRQAGSVWKRSRSPNTGRRPSLVAQEDADQAPRQVER